jgi:DNA-binding transcriptional LysR family regulator
MDNLGMNTFLALVRTQNVSRASEQLNVAQSTVSKRLKQLEQELGTVLFERVQGNKTFRLTPAGEALIPVADRWLSVWREMQSLKFESPKLSLSVGTLDSMNFAIFPRLYQALSRHQPKISLKIVTSHSRELYDLIEHREVDVAFPLLLREHPNIVVEKYFTEPLVGLCMASSARSQSKLVHPHELDPNDELFVYWGPGYKIWHDQWWDPICPGRTLIDTSQLIFSFFSNPRQWAIVPSSVAWKAHKMGNYRIFRFSEAPPDRICYKITHKYPKASTVESIKVLDYYFHHLLLKASLKLNRTSLTLPIIPLHAESAKNKKRP